MEAKEGISLENFKYNKEDTYKTKRDHFKAAYSDLHTSGKEILRQNQNSLERARIGFKSVVRKKLHCGLGEQG